MIRKLIVFSISMVLFLSILYITKKQNLFFNEKSVSTIIEKKPQNIEQQNFSVNNNSVNSIAEREAQEKKQSSETEMNNRLEINKEKLKGIEGAVGALIKEKDIEGEAEYLFNTFRVSQPLIRDQQDSAIINDKIYEMGLYDELIKESVKFSSAECREGICKLDFYIGRNKVHTDSIESRIPVMSLIDTKLKSIPILDSKQLMIKNNIELQTMELYFY